MSSKSPAPRLFTVLTVAMVALVVTGIACIRSDRSGGDQRARATASDASYGPSSVPGAERAPDPAASTPEAPVEGGDLVADSHPESDAQPEIGVRTHEEEESGTTHAAHRFDDPEEWAKRFETPEREAWQKPGAVVELMGVLPGMVVADIGAGTGYFLPHLSRAVGETGRVLALDVEESMVQYLDTRVEREELFNVKPRAVPPDNPTLPPTGVDRVLIVNTWHHIADRVNYAEKLAQGLAPAGSVWIVDFTRDSPMGPAVSERLSPATVVAELRAGGLAAEVVQASLPYQYVIVGRKP